MILDYDQVLIIQIRMIKSYFW